MIIFAQNELTSASIAVNTPTDTCNLQITHTQWHYHSSAGCSHSRFGWCPKVNGGVRYTGWCTGVDWQSCSTTGLSYNL